MHFLPKQQYSTTYMEDHAWMNVVAIKEECYNYIDSEHVCEAYG